MFFKRNLKNFDKLLVRLVKKKEDMKFQNERWDTVTNPTETERDYKEILWRIYTNKLEDFKETGNSARHNL